MTEHIYNGFVARDEDKSLHLFFSEPDKRESEVGQGEWDNDMWDGFPLNDEDFQDVKWEDTKAQRVVIVIKKEI